MRIVGRVESLWRYPVKSMRGEPLREAFAGFAGVYGDRVYAFLSTASPKGFPYFTARDQRSMLGYRACFRYPDRMAAPPNLLDAEALPPGVTPLYAQAGDLMVDVETPSGEVMAVDDPRLLDLLRVGARDGHVLSLQRSERALTDCRPLSLLSIQTVQQIGQEVGLELDKRRFRANAFVDLSSGIGFGENEWVGRRLRIGHKAEMALTDRDPRCKMITLDPATGAASPEIIKRVTSDHEGTAGVYAAVLVECVIREGDEIALLD